MPKLGEKQAELFRGKNWATVVTLREDGSPHATPVWIDTDGENVIFNTSIGREFQIAHDKFGFTEKELRQITRNGIEGAFVDEPTRVKLLARL